ncbi:MAG: hypothetical protein ACK53W_12525 [Gemmatimonadota bacterium]
MSRAALWTYQGRPCVILGEQVRYTRTGGREVRYGIRFLDDDEEASVSRAAFARTARSVQMEASDVD